MCNGPHATCHRPLCRTAPPPSTPSSLSFDPLYCFLSLFQPLAFLLLLLPFVLCCYCYPIPLLLSHHPEKYLFRAYSVPQEARHAIDTAKRDRGKVEISTAWLRRSILAAMGVVAAHPCLPSCTVSPLPSTPSLLARTEMRLCCANPTSASAAQTAAPRWLPA